MKNASLPRIRPALKYIFAALFLTATLAATLVAQTAEPTPAPPPQSSLSLADILVGLRSKKATIAERNRLLTEAVERRGITFALTPEIRKELETTGATGELIESVRQKSPVVKIVPAAVPKPEPTPAATPRAPDFSVYQNRANAHFVKGEYDLAVVNYNKVVEINPNEASAYFSRAQAYSNKKFYDLAITDYDKVIELSPEETAAYVRRAELHEKTGKPEKAVADYQKIVELDAKNEEAKSALKRLQLELAKSSPPPKAQPKESAAVAAPPTDSSLPVNLGALNVYATNMLTPIYPAMAQKLKVQGQVTVEITLDEKGEVVSAKALNGPSLLRQPSEYAARRSKFKPHTQNGSAVKAKGFVIYNFKEQ